MQTFTHEQAVETVDFFDTVEKRLERKVERKLGTEGVKRNGHKIITQADDQVLAHFGWRVRDLFA